MVLLCVEDVHYDRVSGREQGYLPHRSWKADKRAQGPTSPQECASSTLLLKVPQLPGTPLAGVQAFNSLAFRGHLSKL